MKRAATIIWGCYLVYLVILYLLTWGTGGDYNHLGLDAQAVQNLAMNLGLKTRSQGLTTFEMGTWYIHSPAAGVFLVYVFGGGLLAAALHRLSR